MPDQHPAWWDLPLLQSRQTQAATDPVTVDRPPAPHPFTAGHRTPATSHNGTVPTLGLAHRGDSPEPRRTPGVPPHSPAAPVPAAPAAAADLDWSAVRKLRLEAADRLAGRLRDSHGMDPATQREVGRAVVTRVVTEHAEKSLASGGAILSPEQTHAMVSAVMDSLFGLGRLQPLVNLPTVENIEVRGVDNVVLQHNDGRIEPGPPVGETDEELIEQLQFLAARSGEQERPFSPAFPFLNLGLPGNIRLAAAAWVGARPSVWIRRHRLNTATLDDLVELGMMDAGLAGFLAAAVRARMSIVVSGPQGAGKTTLMRAMCQVIDPWESVVTIEGEPELLLDQLGRFHRITSWLTRPSAGETTSRGEVTLDELGHHALRTNADRVIVGEVRGAEVAPMVKAMESGAGSLSTTHTVRGRAVISRLALLLAETRGIPRDTGVAMVAQTVQLIVHVDKDVTTRVDGSTPPRRFVREVIAVEMGEHGKPAYTDVYRPGPSGDAVPGTLPAWLTHLDQFGFDRHEHAAGVQR